MDAEHKELVRPVFRGSGGFYDKVVDLATDEQRRGALAKLQAAAGRHGVQPEEFKAVESALLTRAAASEDVKGNP